MTATAPDVHGVTVLQQWAQAILIVVLQTMKNVGNGTILISVTETNTSADPWNAIM